MCSHVAAVLWYLGFARHKERNTFGVKDWGEYLDDAAVVDESESDSDESVIEEKATMIKFRWSKCFYKTMSYIVQCIHVFGSL